MPAPGWGLTHPIVVGKRVFAVGHPDVVACYDQDSGKVLWQKRIYRSPGSGDGGCRGEYATMALQNNDGIHAACLGGTWQARVNGSGGLRGRADGLHFRPRPRLPRAWNRLAYAVVWQGRRIAVEIIPATVSVRLVAGNPLGVTNHGRPVMLTWRTVSVPLTMQG